MSRGHLKRGREFCPRCHQACCTAYDMGQSGAVSEFCDDHHLQVFGRPRDPNARPCVLHGECTEYAEPRQLDLF